MAPNNRAPRPSRKTGTSDRYPSDYGARDRDDAAREKEKDKSWQPGDAGQGREDLSKGYGGSGGRGTGPSGAEDE